MVNEQDAMPALRRRLWMVLWFILVVTVLWTLVWFMFFRHSPATKTANLKGSNASQSQSSGSGNDGSSRSSAPAPTPAANTPPNQELANAGAGNVLIPFAVASVTGTTVYYIRLRRKLLS